MASSARPILCAVLDVAALGGGRERCRDAALRLFDGGVDWIQLRDRRVEGLVLLEAAEGLVAARDAVPRDPESPCRVIVNRRADVALAAGADGVHLGFDALDPDSARLLLGAQAWLGVSLHAPGEVDSAARQRSGDDPDPPPGPPIDYVHLAPIWDPRSKPARRPALGLAALEQACAAGIAVLAQGGLDADRAVQAVAAGAAGIAVTGRLSQAEDPAAVARRLREALDSTAEPLDRRERQ